MIPGVRSPSLGHVRVLKRKLREPGKELGHEVLESTEDSVGLF